MERLKGQVVLLSFWNCFSPECPFAIREVGQLEEKYRGRPFIVIGIHSSRYGEAIGPASVESAIDRFGITHPVVIDNDLAIWNIYGISLWPSYVIIDAAGTVIGAVSGEGKKAALDRVIGKALDDGEKNSLLASAPLPVKARNRKETLLSYPGKLEIDRDRGHLFVSDTNHHRVLHLEIQGETGAKTLGAFGGNGPGFSDGKPGTAKFNSPMGLSFTGETLYVADTGNHAVRAIKIPGGGVSTIAGNGKTGYSNTYNGNPLRIALNAPYDIVNDGVYLYIAMAGLNQVWQIDIDNNYMSNLVGSGLESMLDGPFSNSTLAKPCGLALKGRLLYIADSGSSALRCADLSTNMLSTVIGAGLFEFGYEDGHFSDARMLHCLGVATAGEKVFVADTWNHAIRFADLMGTVIRSLISQKQESTYRITPDRPESRPLFEPGDVAYYNGRLYIADTGNHCIRVFDLGRLTLNDLVIS